MYDFHVKQVSPVSCELRLDIPLDNKLFKLVFGVAKRAYRKRTGVKIEGSLGGVDAFDVPQSHFKLLSTAIKSCIKDLNEKEFEPDGFRILHYDVVRAEFKRVGGSWKCVLDVEGGCRCDDSFKG